MANKIISYFDLGILPDTGFGDKEGGRKESRKRRRFMWTIALYLAVFLGVLSSHLLDLIRCEGDFSLKALIQMFIIPLIVSTLIFPAVYKMARLDGNKPNGMQFFIAFQEGFFWHRSLSVLFFLG